jgi:putative phosphoribosyl transferase
MTENPGVKIFTDRRAAGVELASRLKGYRDAEGVIVLALPRGGVVTGSEVASYLNCHLDVIIVKKIGFPGQPEFAIGAVSETGTVALNEHVISSYGVSKKYVEEEVSRQKDEIERRVSLYREGQRIPDLKNKKIILIDDGVATGASMKAAISTLKEENVEKLIVAVPVAPPDTVMELEQMVDELVCLEAPADFMAVGAYYQDFTQITDEEVIDILERVGRGGKAH